MKIIKVKDYKEMSLKASMLVAEAIKQNPEITLGLATGSTPEGMYENLIDNKSINWEGVSTFNLDEYIGLKPNHELSYHHYMNEKLFDHIDIQKVKTYVPNGINNPEEESKIYEEFIASVGGIDLQILGIGQNGHIAFNEPGSSFTSKTREVKLTKSTIEANARFFESKDEVPKTAISMGIETITRAKKIILLASGLNKAQAIKETVNGPVTEKVPASILQKHKDVVLIADEEALSKTKI